MLGVEQVLPAILVFKKSFGCGSTTLTGPSSKIGPSPGPGTTAAGTDDPGFESAPSTAAGGSPGCVAKYSCKPASPGKKGKATASSSSRLKWITSGMTPPAPSPAPPLGLRCMPTHCHSFLLICFLLP